MLRIVTQYLRRSAEMNPNKIAFVDSHRSITYSELLVNTEILANTLIQKGLYKKPVAVLMEKSVFAVTAFLGTAMSGNFYSVIDDKMPQARIERILETFRPEIILYDSKNSKKAELISRINGTETLNFDDLLEQTREAAVQENIKTVERCIIDTDILYVLFTSGSTGIPKGVIITHRSVIDYTEWVSETFSFDQNTKFGNQAPLYFDNSVLDIYSTIRNAATLYLIPQMLFAFPIRLMEYVRDHKINTIFWVPTVLSRVVDLNLLDKCTIDCLKKVLFAGEVMPARQLNAWIRRLPKAVFANLYGPTEITVDCTYYIVDRPIRDDESVPIGYACENTDIIVLNDKNERVAVNEKGELCVRGSSLSLGYYNNPEKTDSAFIQNPLNNLYRELIYKTGDIVHYNERGEIIYDGRIDSQIKHTGHRIELGEIETAVSSNEKIERNCCLHDPTRDQLILFYVGDIDEDALRKFLAKLIPEYMLPNIFHKLPQMPLNMNGKIDRMKLKDLTNI